MYLLEVCEMDENVWMYASLIYASLKNLEAIPK